MPWFLWLLFVQEERVAAAVLLAVLGATDWVDGWIARRYDQGSELGKVLDPTADRILLVAAGVALLDRRRGAAVGRDRRARARGLVSLAVLLLAAAGARRIDVQWAGKAGTLALMFALPGFLLVDSARRTDLASDILDVATWIFAIGGLVLSYYAAFSYVPMARRALREGRAARERRMAA